jgi:hypothetical protein
MNVLDGTKKVIKVLITYPNMLKGAGVDFRYINHEFKYACSSSKYNTDLNNEITEEIKSHSDFMKELNQN